MRVFRFGQKCFLVGSFTRTGLCVVPNICQKHVHGLPDLPHSDYPFKFLDNLFLKIPVQWLVIFLEFFDQISETFGMSTVDLIVVFSSKYTFIIDKSLTKSLLH